MRKRVLILIIVIVLAIEIKKVERIQTISQYGAAQRVGFQMLTVSYNN